MLIKEYRYHKLLITLYRFQNKSKIWQVEMSWNQMSDDSWMQEDSGSDAEQPTKAQSSGVKKDGEGGDQNQNKDAGTGKGKDEKQGHDDKDKQKRQVQKKESRKFPTDQQLLEQYLDGKVEDNKRLKIINCNLEQQRQLIFNLEKDKKIKKLRKVPNKENLYFVTFWSKDDLIKFIKEKIEKAYKFKIGIYVESENEKKWRAERQQERKKEDEKRDKERKEQRQQRDNKEPRQYREKGGERENKGKQQYKPKYQEEPKQKQQNKRQYRKEKEEDDRRKDKGKKEEDHNRQKHLAPKQQQKHKQKDYGGQKHRQGGKPHKIQQRKSKQVHEIKSLLRENNRTNKITVLSDDANPADVAKWVKAQGITVQFNDFIFIAPGSLLEYMEKVCQQCQKTLNYGLTSDISEQECQKNSQQTFKFTLTEKKKSKPIKKHLAAVYLSKTNEQSFENYQKFNIHVIGNKQNLADEVLFDQKQYIELFKKNFPRIVQKWQKWILYAYGKNIAKLLRLSGAIKKLETRAQFNYQVGMSDKIPFARFQLFDLGRAKCKVDTSAVNSHLQG